MICRTLHQTHTSNVSHTEHVHAVHEWIEFILYLIEFYIQISIPRSAANDSRKCPKNLLFHLLADHCFSFVSLIWDCGKSSIQYPLDRQSRLVWHHCTD